MISRPKLVLAIVLLLIIVLAGSRLVGFFRLNGGLLHLGRAIIASHSDSTIITSQQQQQIRRAVLALGAASQRWPNNRTAARGFGLALALQGREEEAVVAWSRIEGLAQELAQYGEQARRAGRIEEALQWYHRAYRLAPNSTFYAFFTGRLYERLGQWPEAILVYNSALAQGNFGDVGPEDPAGSNPYPDGRHSEIGRSDFTYRLGLIYQLRLSPSQPGQAKTAYSLALAFDDFQSTITRGDTYYHLGELYENEGAVLGTALALYQQAVRFDPNHHWAHLRLAFALYRVSADLAVVEQELETALALWPADQSRKWPYRIQGDIYRMAGLLAEAIVAYKEALRLDPTDEHSRSMLVKLIREG